MSTKQDHKRWRKEFNEKCLKRDGAKCVFCEIKEDLDVHHITNRKDVPNGGYAPTNGITLCSEHHWEAEQFHMSGVAKPGFSPEDLYKKIGSSYEKAVQDCEGLK
jgi:hypothetical protein